VGEPDLVAEEGTRRPRLTASMAAQCVAVCLFSA
jgi:hypothetical protein